MQLVEFEFSTVSSVPDDLDAMSALELKFASPEGTQSRSDGNTSSTKEPLIVDSMGLPLRTNQQQVLSNLLRVRGLANSTRARVEQEQTYEFLNACTGNLERMRVVGCWSSWGMHNICFGAGCSHSRALFIYKLDIRVVIDLHCPEKIQAHVLVRNLLEPTIIVLHSAY